MNSFLIWLFEVVATILTWLEGKIEWPEEPEPPAPVEDNLYYYKGEQKASFYLPKVDSDTYRAKFNEYSKKIAWNGKVKYLAHYELSDMEWRPIWTQAGVELLAKLPADAQIRTMFLARHIEDTRDFENSHEDVRLVEFDGRRGFVFACEQQPYKNSSGQYL